MYKALIHIHVYECVCACESDFFSCLGYEKYSFSRKGSVFQVLMEKNHSMFRVVTRCLGAFRRPFCSSIGTQLGAKHPPPRPRELRLVLRFLKELPFECWHGGGGGRWAFFKKIPRNLGMCVYFFVFFVCFFFSLVVVNERERGRNRINEKEKKKGKKLL